jgi:hypothetical protein
LLPCRLRGSSQEQGQGHRCRCPCKHPVVVLSAKAQHRDWPTRLEVLGQDFTKPRKRRDFSLISLENAKN